MNLKNIYKRSVLGLYGVAYAAAALAVQPGSRCHTGGSPRGTFARTFLADAYGTMV